MATEKHTAVMWSLVNGRWFRINAARMAVTAKKDTRGTVEGKPEVTVEQLYEDLKRRVAFAEEHGLEMHIVITDDGGIPPIPG